MKNSQSIQIIESLLEPCDVQINGKRPWDLQVHNTAFFNRVLAGGALALGESYMDGWWDCDAIDQFFTKILANRLDRKVKAKSLAIAWYGIRAKILNAQKRSRAFIIGQRHYDIGNELFSIMLDKRLNYSCAYWEKAQTLDEAQEDKLDLICRKMNLRPGMKILDIGCGWGSFVKYAAEKYGVSAHGITVSKEQHQFGVESCRELDVKFELKDYRDLKDKYDRIISIGMFEHVGVKNYRTFMNIVNSCLNKNGLFLLHTIGGNISLNYIDPWTHKYIFPNAMAPSAKQITTAYEGIFVMEDWHSFGQYYATTLEAWYENFTKNWNKLKDTYDERFYRMWSYYLLSNLGAFRSRKSQLWQIVFSKRGVPGGHNYRKEYSSS
jgi:cyclopropane-fatty-acyl-phospholipid synthase